MESVKPTPEQEALLRKTFHLSPTEPVPELHPIYGGLTNESFRFTLGGEDYFLREPGYDTTEFIDRQGEAAVYQAISDPKLTDEILVLEPDSGRKITRFWQDARTCDPQNETEVAQCMALLRELHGRALHVEHKYDLFALNEIFIRLMPPSVYPTHGAVQQRCMDMKSILEPFEKYAVLCHCDTSYTNFLFVSPKGVPELHLIDWEYAGEHDLCLDIAVFANAANYTREQLDHLMEVYLGEAPTKEFILRVYGYYALACMLWSNWAEYESANGMDCGDYGPHQFENAAHFSELFWELVPQVVEEAHP